MRGFQVWEEKGILGRVIREGFSEEVTFEQRPG